MTTLDPRRVLSAEETTDHYLRSIHELIYGVDDEDIEKLLIDSGAVKHVYPRDTMGELRSWFTAIADRLPAARLLYWT